MLTLVELPQAKFYFKPQYRNSPNFVMIKTAFVKKHVAMYHKLGLAILQCTDVYEWQQ